MGILTLIVLALGMSMDAFAAALARGAALSGRVSFGYLLRTGLVFGGVEMLAPLIGFGLGTVAVNLISEWDHWVAFVLLFGLGARMIYEGWQNDDDDEQPENETAGSAKKGAWLLVLTAIGTSIDSMIVGVSLAFLEVNIWVAAIAIGLATTIMATLGLWLGRILGDKIGRWAEIAGGLVLIAIGSLVLVEHLGLWS